MNRFQKTLLKQNEGRPPVWLMRQAGRYHSHYQKLRKEYSFMELCKNPDIACETTMGPIRDFDFDAAILFSDLLFPLEAMGMGLRYEPGPILDWHLKELSQLKNLRGGKDLVEFVQFQGEALKKIRAALPKEKGLLGFVGGPLTLYCYAVEGSHKGNLTSAISGLSDGRWEGFFEKLADLLIENMVLQAQSGADTVAVLDTCGGEISETDYQEKVIPKLRYIVSEFKKRCPGYPLVYYSKGTGPSYWQHLQPLEIEGLGIDWNHPIAEVLSKWSSRFAIQGNVDPHWLFLPSAELEQRLRKVFQSVKELPLIQRKGWICGLGHGVLPKTPEENVRLFVRLQREIFAEGQ